MFTGIVSAVGRIVKAESLRGDVRFTIDAGQLDLSDVAIGDSIAVSGCCLTAIDIVGNCFIVEVSRETLACTTGLEENAEVNLEKALRMADRVGGHLVTGHVDCVAEVLRFAEVGESWLLRVRVPTEIARYIARKGSVTLNGVSLTVNEVEGREFEVNLIPHTLQVTTLKQLRPGSPLNLEVDLIARYVERNMNVERG
jgi:riboflavin synthase